MYLKPVAAKDINKEAKSKKVAKAVKTPLDYDIRKKVHIAIDEYDT